MGRKKKAMEWEREGIQLFFSPYPLPLKKMLLVLQLPGWSLASRTPWDYALKSWQVNSVTQAKPLISSGIPSPLTARKFPRARCSSSAPLADEIMTQ